MRHCISHDLAECPACDAQDAIDEAAYQTLSASIRGSSEATRLTNEKALDDAWLRGAA